MIVNNNPVTPNITVNCPLGITGISEQTVNIYPNPANETIIIDGL